METDRAVPKEARSGLDSTALVVIRALHADFVDSHFREHQLADAARDAFMAERDQRYTERFTASQTAINAATSERDHAIQKSEVAVEKRADAMYVTIQKMQEAMGAVMPRSEAESRFVNQEQRIGATMSRLDRAESKGAGMSTLAGALVAGIGLLISIVSIVVLLVKP